MISNPDIRGYQIVEVKMDGSEKRFRANSTDLRKEARPKASLNKLKT